MSQVVRRRIEKLPYPLPPKYGNLPMQNAMMNWWSWYFIFLWQNSDSMMGRERVAGEYLNKIGYILSCPCLA